MFFDFDAIYNEAQGSVFASGKRRYYDNKVKSITTATVDGKFTVSAKVSGDREYNCSICFDEQGGLYDYSCDCDGFSLASGPCRHIVATALSFEERNPTSSMGAVTVKKTDAGALSLISEYNKRKHRRLIKADGVLTELVPYLELGDFVSLRFTLGAKKQYVLKDLSDFVSSLASCGYRRYGVDLELYHTPSSFTENSQKLIDFVRKCYNEKVQFDGNFMRFKDELRLSYGDIDDFFALYEGSLIHLGKSDLVLVAPFTSPLPIKIKVQKEDDGYSVSLTQPDFRFIEGKDYKYALVDERIFRITNEFYDTVCAFFQTLAVKRTLFVSESDMSAFYNGVLCPIGAFVETESNGVDLSVYEAAPLTASVYIDAEEGGVRLTVKASYDETPVDLFSEMTSGDFVRDWETENALRGVLLKYISRYPDLVISDEEELFVFLTEGVKELFCYAEVFMEESMKSVTVRKPPRLHVGVRLSTDLLNLDITAEGYTQSEIAEILKAYREKKRYVRLGGGFVSLEDSSIMALGEILAVAKAEESTLTLPKYYAPFAYNELKRGFFTLDRDGAFKSLIKSLEGAENSDEEVPVSLQKIMRNYQKTGYHWLKSLKSNGFGGILADDMGLGKSLQALALLVSEKSRAIIVCPTTLMLNWQSEVEKFAPSIKTLIVMGNALERAELIKTVKDYDLTITSYDLLRRDWELYKDIKFDYAIADEAQLIKNPETKNSMAVKTLDARHRFALTGTPIENNLGELWSIFDFIMPGYLGSYSHFRDEYESEVVRGDKSVAERLKRIVQPFILRRLKSEVLTELPPKTEIIMRTPMEKEQRELYDANLSLIKGSMISTPDMSKVVVLSMLTKLRQICCEPKLVYPEYSGSSAKMDACMELVKTASEGGHKILLFSQFTGMLSVIQARLMEEGISHYVLKGDTPKAERMRLISKFNENDVKVFLISLKAGGTGINLTGADVVIHYDPWWNESVMNQATDRAYRMGQKKSVQVYKLVAKDSLEEKIMLLQEKKKALSSLVVGKNNDLKEILALLNE